MTKWNNNLFHKVKHVLNYETICHMSPITFGHLLLNGVPFLFLQEIKNLSYFWTSGPFVLRDYLVLFQMLSPGSDIGFCSAFHVGQHRGRAFGIKAAEMTPNQSFEGF